MKNTDEGPNNQLQIMRLKVEIPKESLNLDIKINSGAAS